MTAISTDIGELFMHDTAYNIAMSFFAIYVPNGSRVIELGSENYNGAIRDGLADHGLDYVGCDLQPGDGVDVVIDMGTRHLPFPEDSFDIAIASSVFEHDDFFWDTFLKMCRVVKPGGYIYLNVPSNGWIHRYPVDNWRFYPDAGQALARWARRNDQAVTLVESFVAWRVADVWNDFCAVFRKGELEGLPASRLYQSHVAENIFDISHADRINVSEFCQDQRIIAQLNQRLEGS